MKKIGSILAFIPASVLAVDFEIGAGVAHYTTRGNGMWYQEGMPYKLDMNAPALEAGITDTAWSYGRWGLDWRASFVYLGEMRSDAIGTTDENYSQKLKGCIDQCETQNRFVGHGHMSGVRLTLTPTYSYNGWKYGIEGGAYIFRPTWHETMYYNPRYPQDKAYSHEASVNFRGTTKMQIAPVIGASIGYKNFSVSYLHYFNKTLNDPMYAIWKQTDTITLRYRF